VGVRQNLNEVAMTKYVLSSPTNNPPWSSFPSSILCIPITHKTNEGFIKRECEIGIIHERTLIVFCILLRVDLYDIIYTTCYEGIYVALSVQIVQNVLRKLAPPALSLYRSVDIYASQ